MQRKQFQEDLKAEPFLVLVKHHRFWREYKHRDSSLATSSKLKRSQFSADRELMVSENSTPKNLSQNLSVQHLSN